MAFHTPVPSETEASSLSELVDDCREVANVLAHTVLDLTAATASITRSAVKVPLARVPLDRLPFSFGAMPVEITEDLLVTVSGLDDY
jgi:hypothetical protein